MGMVVNAQALDERLARLEGARAWSPRVVSRLEALIRDGDDAALFRVNPFTLAKARDLEAREAVDLLLHAAAQGLFEMDWLLICPRCACAVESFARLRAVHRRYSCPECRNEYEAAMDDYIAIYFTIAPQVASIRYHRPETLDAFDYFYHYRGVREGRLPDGTPFVEASRAALVAIGYVEPGQGARFGFEAAPGLIEGVSSDIETRLRLRIADRPAEGPQRVAMAFDGRGLVPGKAELAAGPVELAIANPTAERRVLALLRASADAPPDAFLRFDPYLTGKHLLTSQTFKSLFRSEVVGGAEGLAIRDIALLFTDIKGSTALYQRVGDLNAFQLVQQHFDWLREATVRQDGSVVKTIGDAVMAAYPDAARAVAAALEMQAAVGRFNREQPERPVELKIGIHHGAAIAVTLNDELDYFGQTVNIASRVQELADAAEICVTEEVWSYPGVRELLARHAVETTTAGLQGIERPMPVMRVSSGPAAAQ